MARRHRTFSDKFWLDRHGRFVVWQKPNALLITWFVTFLLTIVYPNDDFLERGLSFISGLAIFIWAVLELFRGANYFRRSLGLGVLLLFAVGYFL